VSRAIVLALEKKIRGVYNVAGPQPLPLSVLAREAGRTVIPLPEALFTMLLGRFGLPKLPPGAIAHIKYPVVVDAAAFRAATGFKHTIDEVQAVHEYRAAFPV
jgi:UDP-glucose 4-epimerase